MAGRYGMRLFTAILAYNVFETFGINNGLLHFLVRVQPGFFIRSDFFLRIGQICDNKDCSGHLYQQNRKLNL